MKTPLRCHSYGMVGFVKQLVDEQGAHDVTRKQWRGKSKRESKFENMIITPSIVFIRKADHEHKKTGEYLKKDLYEEDLL